MLRPIPTPEVISKAARARSLLYVPAQNDQKAKDGAARTSGEMSGSMSSTLGVSKKPGRSELQRQNPQNQQKKTSPSSKQTASATLCCPQSAQRWPIVMLYTAQHSFVIYTDVRSLNMVGKFDRFWILRTIAGEKHLFLEYLLNPQFLTLINSYFQTSLIWIGRRFECGALQLELFPSLKYSFVIWFVFNRVQQFGKATGSFWDEMQLRTEEELARRDSSPPSFLHLGCRKKKQNCAFSTPP